MAFLSGGRINLLLLQEYAQSQQAQASHLLEEFNVKSPECQFESP